MRPMPARTRARPPTLRQIRFEPRTRSPRRQSHPPRAPGPPSDAVSPVQRVRARHSTLNRSASAPTASGRSAQTHRAPFTASPRTRWPDAPTTWTAVTSPTSPPSTVRSARRRTPRRILRSERRHRHRLPVRQPRNATRPAAHPRLARRAHGTRLPRRHPADGTPTDVRGSGDAAEAMRGGDGAGLRGSCRPEGNGAITLEVTRRHRRI